MSDAAERRAILGQPYISAEDLLKIWDFYDSDGNGFMEGKELEDFFRELAQARHESEESGEESMKTFMDKYDKNSDGRIELAELAQILPTEESFLLFFRQQVRSSTEFMEAWRHYDSDRSGYIESDELKDFLRDLLKKANREFDEDKLEEYTQTTLRMFDTNQDGKLGLSEMARLLPVQENFLLKMQGEKLTPAYFSEIFDRYDTDCRGYIDKKEVDDLLRDLLGKNAKDEQTLSAYKQGLLNLVDDGQLYRRELEIVLCGEPL
uniref:calretinin-like n=1 Tax=Myxine glutinosa TaxID=7769 RepID=UPI00358E85D9